METPELDMDFVRNGEGLIMLPQVQKKMEDTLKEVDVLQKEASRYFILSTIGIIVSTILVFTSYNFAWFLTFLFTVMILFFQTGTLNKARQRLRFVDGIMFVTIETSKDFAQFRTDVEGKIPPEVTEAIKNLRKSN